MNSFIEPNENNFNNEFELDKGKINYEFPRNHLPLDRMKKYNTIDMSIKNKISTNK